jgi:hypothetical protein
MTDKQIQQQKNAEERVLIGCKKGYAFYYRRFLLLLHNGQYRFYNMRINNLSLFQKALRTIGKNSAICKFRYLDGHKAHINYVNHSKIFRSEKVSLQRFSKQVYTFSNGQSSSAQILIFTLYNCPAAPVAGIIEAAA